MERETCFSFLVGLVITVILYLGTVCEKKTRPQYTNSQLKELLDEHIHSERDRSIAYDRLANKIKFEPLAEKYELSVRQTKKIVYRCEKVIISHL